MSSTPRWTTSQQAAIEHTDGALLVSAAAGSGKTAVLAARCVHLVCEATVPCDVDQLLVLTFTRAAAGEMRERIEKALREHIEQKDDPRLQRQLRLIDRASITTLDGFCASLVRANFHLLGIDPGFSILAPEDAALLKAEVVDRLLDGEYDSERADALKSLLDGYFGGDDTRLRSHLIAADSLMQSIVDPQDWSRKAIARLAGGADGSDQELIRLFGEMQQRSLRTVLRQLDAAKRFAQSRDGFAKYVAHVDELSIDVQSWLDLSIAGDYDRLSSQVQAYKTPRLPTVPKDTPDKEPAKDLIDAAKAELKKRAASLCQWSLKQLRTDLAQIAPHATHFLSLTERFTAAYDHAKHELRTLDFADTERLAYQVLREPGDAFAPSASAKLVHERFLHVLVDEFQDINPLQNAILRLISRDASAELDRSTRSNFFTVGDVKQSIYRFRLAEPQQFIDRHASLREPGSVGRVIDLQENFRSRGPLLEAVNDVFRLLMTSESTGIGYDASHELRWKLPYPDLGPKAFQGKPIELHILPREVEYESKDASDEDDDAADSFEREIELVAHRIREIIAERRVVAVKQGSELVSREVQYGDIAVLLRSARFKSSIVADELRAQGIPVHAEDSTGFFTNPEVQDVLTLLRLISNQQQDIPMAAFLRSPIAAIESPEDALATIRLASPEEPFHRAAVLYANSNSDALATTLTKLFLQLVEWRKRFQVQNIGESLSQLLDETRYLTFCRALPDGAQRAANLQELLERAVAFDSFERQGLDRFLAFLEELENDDQLGRPSIPAESANYVRVMTVHKSKGLEFPIVIVPDLGKQFNEQSLSSPILLDRDLGIGLSAVNLRARVRYPSLASMVIKSHMRRQAIAEEVRVLYVALTRAREHLILIGSSKPTFADIESQWSSHVGPLPDETIHHARTALDWIAPIAAITRHNGLGTFSVKDWNGEQLPRAGASEADESPQKQLERWFHNSTASKETLSEAPQQSVDRLTYRYAQHDSTIQPSTRRVTDEITHIPSTNEKRMIDLPWPSTYRPRAKASAMEIGTATHRFLELLDPARADSVSDIEQQIQAFVARRLIDERDAKLVDREVAMWFAASEIGRLLRAPGTRVLREQSLAYSIPLLELPEGDCALVRGRLDALLDTPDGLVLLDYKTDRVEPHQVADRAESYWPQLRGYVRAVQGITKRPVGRASLVFLQARQIIDLPAELLAPDA